MADPVALVTGANRGIGREVARQLGEEGYEVFVSARDEAKARGAADAVGGRALELDVSDAGSIERAAAATPISPRSSRRSTRTSSGPTA